MKNMMFSDFPALAKRLLRILDILYNDLVLLVISGSHIFFSGKENDRIFALLKLVSEFFM